MTIKPIIKKALQDSNIALVSKVLDLPKGVCEYEKATLDFWNNDSLVMNLSIGTADYGSPYWQTVFETKRIKQLNGVPLRKMSIYTKRPLHKIPELDCLLDDLSFEVRLYHASNPTYFRQDSVQSLLDYTLAVTEKLVNKTFKCTKENAAYFIAPLETTMSQNAFQESIDWIEIEKTLKNNMKQNVSVGHTKLNDAIVFESTDLHKLYFIEDEFNNLGDTSVRAYSVKRDVSRDRLVSQLAPQICCVYPMSASVYQTAQLLPEILMQLDQVLLARQFKRKCHLHFIDDMQLLEAIRSPSCNEEKDYERLEFLGDAILKFVTSTYLYSKHPKYQEGELTRSRTAITCNNSLAALAKELELFRYIITQSTPRRFWRPPQFQCQVDSEKIRHRLAYHVVSCGTMADMIEAIVGAAFLSGSLDGALRAIGQLKILTKPPAIWSDIAQMYKASAHPKLSCLTPDLISVSKSLDFNFKNYALVQEALTHGSASAGDRMCYERLEFLGDALLDFYVTRYMYEKHPTASPNILHNLRKSSVNHRVLSAICLKMGLHKHIIHSSASIAAAVMKFKEKHKKAVLNKEDTDEYWLKLDPPKALSDVMESLMGAMLVDSEFDVKRVEEFFERWIKPILERHVSVETMAEHPMSQLNHLIQELGCMEWEIKSLPSTVLLVHGQVFATGSGKTKKEERLTLATNSCKRLKEDADAFKSLCTCRKE